MTPVQPTEAAVASSRRAPALVVRGVRVLEAAAPGVIAELDQAVADMLARAAR